jgi:hypothetical protein
LEGKRPVILTGRWDLAKVSGGLEKYKKCFKLIETSKATSMEFKVTAFILPE